MSGDESSRGGEQAFERICAQPSTKNFFRARARASLLAAILLFGVATHAQSPAQPDARETQQPSQQPTRSQQPQQQPDDPDDLINADRPGIADGSAVVGARRVQIESGVQAEFRRDGDAREHTLFVPTLLRVGVGKKIEARVEGNTFTRDTVIDPASPTTHTDGLAPVSVGFKVQFQESKGARHPSVGTIFRVFPESGTGDFHSNHTQLDARLAADWDFAPHLSLNPNVGVARYEDDAGRAFAAALFAATLNYLPTKKLNPFVDVGVQSPEESGGRSSVIFDGGIAYILGRNVQLDASVGTGAHGNTPPRPFVGFGVSLRSHRLGKGK